MFSMADPQQSSQSQCTFFVKMIKKSSREITLQTSAIDVSAEKLYVCCIKMREREKGGERKNETDLKLEKQQLSSCFELLVGLALNRLLTVKSTAMKVRFANGAKNKFAAFPQT